MKIKPPDSRPLLADPAFFANMHIGPAGWAGILSHWSVASRAIPNKIKGDNL